MAIAAAVECLVAPSPRFGVRATPASPSAFVNVAVLSPYSGLRTTSSRRGARVISAKPVSRAGRRGAAVVCEAQDTAVNIPDVTKDNWDQEVLSAGIPVLVDFWAPWCGPCRMMHPVVSNLMKTYEGKLKCFKLNTDENKEIATNYGVRSIPTIMIFKNGEKKDTIIGAVPETTLVTSIEKFV